MVNVKINAFQQVARQRNTHFLRTPEAPTDIRVHQRPNAACVFRIGKVSSKFACDRNGCTTFGQNLDVGLYGRFCHLNGILLILSCRKTSRQIRHLNTPGTFTVTGRDCDWIEHLDHPLEHAALLIVRELKG